MLRATHVASMRAKSSINVFPPPASSVRRLRLASNYLYIHISWPRAPIPPAGQSQSRRPDWSDDALVPFRFFGESIGSFVHSPRCLPIRFVDRSLARSDLNWPGLALPGLVLLRASLRRALLRCGGTGRGAPACRCVPVRLPSVCLSAARKSANAAGAVCVISDRPGAHFYPSIHPSTHPSILSTSPVLSCPQ